MPGGGGGGSVDALTRIGAIWGGGGFSAAAEHARNTARNTSTLIQKVEETNTILRDKWGFGYGEITNR